MGEKLKDKIGESDRETITKKCDEIIKWLDANQLAEVDEFTDKQKEVEGICNPIITKLYQAAGGAPGGMPGGMPGGAGGPGCWWRRRTNHRRSRLNKKYIFTV